MDCDFVRTKHKTDSCRTVQHSDRKSSHDCSSTGKSSSAVPHPKCELRENLRTAAASKRDSGAACPTPSTSAPKTFPGKRTAQEFAEALRGTTTSHPCWRFCYWF